jgi:hypothetical protein
MCKLCSIFVEIESTNNKCKINVNVMCYALDAVVNRRVVSMIRLSCVLRRGVVYVYVREA